MRNHFRPSKRNTADYRALFRRLPYIADFQPRQQLFSVCLYFWFAYCSLIANQILAKKNMCILKLTDFPNNPLHRILWKLHSSLNLPSPANGWSKWNDDLNGGNQRQWAWRERSPWVLISLSSSESKCYIFTKLEAFTFLGNIVKFLENLSEFIRIQRTNRILYC